MNWKNLKSLFVVEEGDQKAKKEPPKKEPKKKEQPTTGGKNTIVKVTNNDKEQVPAPKSQQGLTPKAEQGEIKQEFVDHLLKAINNNNLDGFDYLEYKNTLQSLSKMPMDEPLRFQSAFAAAQTMGVTVDSIMESAGHYLNILGAEEEKFRNAMERGMSQKVEGEMQRSQNLQKARAEKIKLIEQLQKEIGQIEEQIQSINAQVMEDQVKIDSKRNHFYASYEFVVNQIKSDIINLDKFVNKKGGTDTPPPAE